MSKVISEIEITIVRIVKKYNDLWIIGALQGAPIILLRS
jgi:hypothetical protein